ncbi:MAG TPA: 6-phosphogluconolactonase [Cyclobacteriaceae bacterium]
MIHVFETPDDLITATADFVVAQSKKAIQNHGRFSLVLSGGSSPKKLHELLASNKYRNLIEWSKVFFFFGDERYVPADHADSNYLMAKNTLFDPLQIPAGQVFKMNTTLSPTESAQAYEKDILAFFSDKSIRFDLIILGLGDDSHTASLFPHTSVLREKDALVKSLYIEKVKMDRITLTAPLINQSHQIAFLVYGAGKADAIHHVIEGATNIEEHPAQLIDPKAGDLHWFIDKAAGSKLK